MIPVAANASVLPASSPHSLGLLLMGVYDGGQVDLSGVDLLFKNRGHPIESCQSYFGNMIIGHRHRLGRIRGINDHRILGLVICNQIGVVVATSRPCTVIIPN